MGRNVWDLSLLLVISHNFFTIKSSQAKIFDSFLGEGAQHMILILGIYVYP